MTILRYIETWVWVVFYDILLLLNYLLALGRAYNELGFMIFFTTTEYYTLL
jgi:hypothetical protein